MLVVALFCGFALASPAPRSPLPQPPLRAVPPSDAAGDHELVVKFIDDALVRAQAGTLRSLAGSDLGPAVALASAWQATFRPLIQLPDADLAALEARAEARSGRAQPDLAGMVVVESSGDPGELEALAEAFADLAVVEWAQIELTRVPPPGDISPTTPDLSSLQSYVPADPGVDVEHLQGLGVLGAGVRVADVEYGWEYSHEDLVDVTITQESGQTVPGWVASYGWDSHGTAALGLLAAPHNGYGIAGTAPDATFYTYPEYSNEEGSRRASAIASAVADSEAGDVIMLEMQTAYPGSYDYVPAEWDNSVWTVSKLAVDSGIHVVAAAGNGDRNLDSSTYSTYAARGDSGAIIVGAGTADTRHDKLYFSTYGSRVDVQGWGEDVMTLGYGSYATYGGDPDQTYTWFSGTSSATPIVASTVAGLQSLFWDVAGAPLPPYDLRDLLIQTGLPQGSGGEVGPIPDLAAAEPTLGVWSWLGYELAGAGGAPGVMVAGSGNPGSTFSVTVTGAPAGARVLQVAGTVRQDASWKGGTRVPSLTRLTPLGTTTSGGTLSATQRVPATLAAGDPLYLQWFVVDATAPDGLSFTQAVRLVAQ